MRKKFHIMVVIVSSIISGAVFAENIPHTNSSITVNPGSDAGTQDTGGVVEFTGSITDNSCNVDSSSTKQSVDLGKWASSYFTDVSVETTKTAFHIKVNDCPASVNNVAVLFDGPRDEINANLLATTGDATGVAIKLYEDDKSTVINLGSQSRAQNVVSGSNEDGASVVLTFFANYISTGAEVSAGSANGTANFNMIYN